MLTEQKRPYAKRKPGRLIIIYLLLLMLALAAMASLRRCNGAPLPAEAQEQEHFVSPDYTL